MKTPSVVKMLVISAVIGGLTLGQSVNAFADRDHRDRGRSFSKNWHHDRYYDRYDRHHGWHSGRPFFKVVFGSPSIGVVFTTLPFGHRTVIHGGVTYYHYNKVYYKRCPSGYVVVPPPIIVNAAPIYGQTSVIHVPNSNGSYTQVTLIRQQDGYVGPQGEYYPSHPTVEQLRVLYGK